jgi:hypothetical protein
MSVSSTLLVAAGHAAGVVGFAMLAAAPVLELALLSLRARGARRFESLPVPLLLTGFGMLVIHGVCVLAEPTSAIFAAWTWAVIACAAAGLATVRVVRVRARTRDAAPEPRPARPGSPVAEREPSAPLWSESPAP